MNLQAANTVINVDLPWNPALLEQRIGRAHRMGQKRPVQVFILITEQTLEESLLNTIAAKRDLSLAVLDPQADAAEVALASGIDELKARMEVLLGEKPATPADETQRQAVRETAATLARQDRMARAGGQLLGAAFEFIGAMFPDQGGNERIAALSRTIREQLAAGLERGEGGELHMTIALPSEAMLDNLARSLACVVNAGMPTL